MFEELLDKLQDGEDLMDERVLKFYTQLWKTTDFQAKCWMEFVSASVDTGFTVTGWRMEYMKYILSLTWEVYLCRPLNKQVTNAVLK